MAHHRAPILHAEPDIGEHLRERRHDRAALRVVVDAPDMDMDEAFPQDARRRRALGDRALEVRALEIGEPPLGIARHREDRMHHQAHVDAALRQLRHDRVHQERHVVVDDLQNRDVLEPIARNGAGGGLETNLGDAGLPYGEQRPGALRHGRHLARLIGQKVLRRGAGEQPGNEGFGNIPALPEQRGRGIDQGRDGRLGVRAWLASRAWLGFRVRLIVERHGFPRERLKVLCATCLASTTRRRDTGRRRKTGFAAGRI